MILTITLNPAIDKVYEIEDFSVGQVFRPKAMTDTAGGKGLNVARVIHLLGEKVMVTGFLGGHNGQLIGERLRAAGITSHFLEIEGETRVCIAIMDRQNHTSTEILEPGPQVEANDALAFLDHYDRLSNEVRIVTVSGSLPAGLDVDFYRSLAEKAKSKNQLFLLDTSGSPLERAISAKPYMVKPNLDEVQMLLKRKLPDLTTQAKAVAELKEAGIALPCLTLGGNGSLVALDDGVYHFFGPELNVLNTVGSGDSFVAGCAVALQRGWSKRDVIRLGMACGMANTQFFQTGMISQELVAKFYQQIRIEKILSSFICLS